MSVVWDESKAEEILAISGMDKNHKDYAELKSVLTAMFNFEVKRAEDLAAIGQYFHRISDRQDSGNQISDDERANLRKVYDYLASQEPHPLQMLRICMTFAHLAQSRITEAARQKRNIESSNEVVERDEKIRARYQELTGGSNSTRAASRIIKSELNLPISIETIRKIIAEKSG